MQHQLGGFCLLFVLLGLLALVGQARDRLHTHYWQSKRLQTELQHTLQHAQHALQEAGTKLANDKSLYKHIAWQLTHSAQQSINTATAHTEYGQVAIFGKKCTLLYGAPHPPAHTQKLCHTLRRGQAITFTTSEPPQLAHLHAFPRTAGAILLTLPLHEKWLAQQLPLATLRANLPATRLLPHNTDDTPARFVYTQTYLNHLFEHAPHYQHLLLWLQTLLYITLTVLCATLYLLARRRTHALRSDLQHLATWSEQPTASEQPQSKAQNTLVQHTLLNFSRTLQAQLHHLSSTKKQIAVKNKLLARAHKENQHLRHTLTQQTLARSVVEQAAQCSAHFVTNNIAIRDNAQDLRAAIFAVHRQQLKPLLQLSRKWQQEFKQRHVADFLGAYYNAEQENFLLQLEKDMRHLAALTEETYLSLSNTLSFTRQLSSQTRNILIPLQFWSKILARHATVLTIKFTSVLCQAQELTTKINTPQRITFINRFDADYRLQAAPTTLAAAFYHLYKVFLPETPTATEIISHTTLKNKQLFVTISTTHNNTNKHEPSKNFHLTQARMILQKYHIEVLLSWLNSTLVVSTQPNTNTTPQHKQQPPQQDQPG